MRQLLIPAIALALAATIAGITALRLDEPPEGRSAQTAPGRLAVSQPYRSPQAGIARAITGQPRDPALVPTEPVLPWDSSVLHNWMERTRAELEAEITDQAVLERARDRTPRTTEGRPGGLYFHATYDAIDMLFSGADKATRRHGFYILLCTALAGDATAYHNLGVYLVLNRDVPGAEHHFAYFRRAADRDFMPSIVNTIDILTKAAPEDAETIEAYLRYGFDLDVGAEYGGQAILHQLHGFYVFANPDRPDDGYLERSIERHLGFGDVRMARLTELQMRVLLNRLPKDPARELELAQRLAGLGDAWGMQIAGNRLGDAHGPAFDKDLARDYFMACLRLEPDNDYCMLNMGSLYAQDEAGPADYALAVALFNVSAGLGGPAGPKGAEQSHRFMKALGPGELATSQRYERAIREGDFSALPHVKDARPIPAVEER